MHVYKSYGKIDLSLPCIITHYNAYERTVTGVSKINANFGNGEVMVR